MTEKLKPVSIREVCDELGFDIVEVENDSTGVIKRKIKDLIEFSDVYLKGTVGKNYPVDDERAKRMALLIITELYDKEISKDNFSNITQKILNDLELQLKAELREE